MMNNELRIRLLFCDSFEKIFFCFHLERNVVYGTLTVKNMSTDRFIASKTYFNFLVNSRNSNCKCAAVETLFILKK